MKGSGRKTLSTLLALAMLISLLPAMAGTARATGTTVTTKAELMNAVKNSGEIVLGADIVLTDDTASFDYYLVEIKSGIEITLDLNGHVLDRSRIDLGQSTNYGWAIENKGTLVIKDSNPSTPHTLYKKAESWRPNVYTVEDKSEDSNYTVAATITGGAIIGAYSNEGGAINNKGTLTLEGGTICGNEAGSKGGGVWNQSSGTFTMTGGKICNNKTTGGYKWGGGGVQNDGTFLMTGGTITANSIQYRKGGGVFNAGTFQISGSPVITGNGNGNVYLMSFSEYDGKPIEVVGTLDEAAEVGVCPEDAPPITVTTGFKTYMDGQDQTKYFFSDLSGWYALLDADGEVMLSKPDPVPYVYYTLEDSVPTKHTDGSCEGYTAVKSDTTNWTAGWYVASGEVTIEDRITVSGTVNLILTDGATLTAKKGITVNDDDYDISNGSANVLNIYAQSNGTGKLYAGTTDGTDDTREPNAAAIGSDTEKNAGTITIHGGTITVNTDWYAAGIGGGRFKDGGTTTIYDGSITAGGIYGSAIGGGFYGDGGIITIYGGNIAAKGPGTGYGGAGIGGGEFGSGGVITINGGTVNAEANGTGAGIGGGKFGTSGKITINGGTVNATGSSGIGCGNFGIGSTYDVDYCDDLTLNEETKVFTLDNAVDVTINGGEITATSIYNACIGTSYIYLSEEGYTLEVKGKVTVNGGTVTAVTETGAAGIGSGFGHYGIDIEANGGTTITGGGAYGMDNEEIGSWPTMYALAESHDDAAGKTYYIAEGIGSGIVFEDVEKHNTITLGDGMVIYGAPTAHPELSEDNLLTLTDGDYTRYQYMTIIEGAADPTAVATPKISPAAGEYHEAQTVTIRCATTGATIHYTTDGSTPTSRSATYTEPFTVSTTTTVKAIAIKDGTSSGVASATYTIVKLHTLTVNVLTQTNAPVTIKLMRGQDQVGDSVTVEAPSDSSGEPTVYTYSRTFESVPDGIYNAVATQIVDEETRTVTSAVVLTASDDSKTVTAEIPVAKVNSVLDVKDGAPAAVVSGLDDEAEANAQAGVTVTYEMDVDDTTTDDPAAAKVDVEAQKIVPAGKTLTMTYMDITITKTTTPDGGTPVTEDIHQTSTVLETIFPYAYAADGYTVWMWRNHLDTVTQLREIAANSATGEDGTFWLDKQNQLVHLFGSDYSIYAIGYVEGNVRPNTNTDDITYPQTTYPVNTEDPTGGTVTASHKQAVAGAKVTLTATPDEGYELVSVTVRDKDGDAVTLTKDEDGSYNFRMPASAVTVSVTFRKVVQMPDTNGVSDWLITDAHIAYINGRPDGSAAPMANITRAETAMIFYRLLKNKDVKITVSFPDVKDGEWYAVAVNTLASLGMIKGYLDGTFGPDTQITRAEFAAIATRFAKATEGGKSFSDVPAGYWAFDNIATAAAYGWVNGYPDDTFGPTKQITRAEVVTIVNHMLGRAADQEYVLANADQLTPFNDLKDPAQWYYFDMVEATNEHDFTRDGGVEKWKK